MISQVKQVLTFSFAFLFSNCFVPVAAPAEEPLVLNVWPGKAVGDYGQIPPERVRALDEAPTKDATWVTNVTTPTIAVYRPPPAINTGVCVLIFPGGGYWNLAMDKEGTEVATKMNSYGITGVVLKYRVPRRAGQPEPLPAPLPLLDAQRAMSLVRYHAEKWDLDPDKIGAMGFSAGGHLAVMTAISFDHRRYEPIDAVDKMSCRPDFAVPLYTGYMLKRPGSDQLADYLHFPKNTPPMFIVHATDDDEPGAQPEQSQALSAALRKAGVSAELHIYSQGGHGFGVRELGLPVCSWPERFVDWLKWQKLYPPSAPVSGGPLISRFAQTIGGPSEPYHRPQMDPAEHLKSSLHSY